MGRRSVECVLVCEDRQHEAFARRFLREMKLVTHHRRIRVKRPSLGRGSAERFVRETYVTELEAGRRGHVDRTLIVLIDGDDVGVGGRLRQLDAACAEEGVPARTEEDRVAAFVPTWNIETWLTYLGGREVDEGLRNYPRLERPRECGTHVRELAEMCRRGTLREPAPASLVSACEEYDGRLR